MTIMDSKLTLRLDVDAIEAAKRYAAARGSSVSKIVEDYFSRLAVDTPPAAIPKSSITAKLRGSLVSTTTQHPVSEADYRAHLEQKYR